MTEHPGEQIEASPLGTGEGGGMATVEPAFAEVEGIPVDDSTNGSDTYNEQGIRLFLVSRQWQAQN